MQNAYLIVRQWLFLRKNAVLFWCVSFGRRLKNACISTLCCLVLKQSLRAIWLTEITRRFSKITNQCHGVFTSSKSCAKRMKRLIENQEIKLDYFLWECCWLKYAAAVHFQLQSLPWSYKMTWKCTTFLPPYKTRVTWSRYRTVTFRFNKNKVICTNQVVAHVMGDNVPWRACNKIN